MSKNFTHLSVASGYSFKFGTASPEKLVEKAAELNLKTLALTDHDNMAGAIRFAKSCEEFGITPILGINLGFIQKHERITLLAQSGKLSSLYRLITAINTNTTDGVLTLEVLENFAHLSAEVIVLLGPQSSLVKNLVSKREGAALSIYQLINQYFAKVAIECVSHLERTGNLRSTSTAAKSLAFALNHHLPAVLTNQVRLLTPSDGPVADLLDASRKLVLISDASVERSNGEGYLKNATQMHQIADQIAKMAGQPNGKELLNTTQDIAQSCQLSPRGEIGLGGLHLPEPKLFGASNQNELITTLAGKAASQINYYYPPGMHNQVKERLEKEIWIINQLGFTSYFLTVASITDAARSLGIRVAARGSAAGSLICHLLGISEVEPIANGLLMERFCSTERNELPDIDIDVESDRRDDSRFQKITDGLHRFR